MAAELLGQKMRLRPAHPTQASAQRSCPGTAGATATASLPAPRSGPPERLLLCSGASLAPAPRDLAQ